jgi:hypothetical protein
MTMLWGLARSPEKVLEPRSCRIDRKEKDRNAKLMREEDLLFEEEREKWTIERERNGQLGRKR